MNTGKANSGVGPETLGGIARGRGWTLIELLVAVSLAVVVATLMSAVFHAVMGGLARSSVRDVRFNSAVTVLERLMDEMQAGVSGASLASGLTEVGLNPASEDFTVSFWQTNAWTPPEPLAVVTGRLSSAALVRMAVKIDCGEDGETAVLSGMAWRSAAVGSPSNSVPESL